ncbi:MAG: hypothetical protein WCV90_02585 [Candidatus Woesearchaeota archaeon]
MKKTICALVLALGLSSAVLAEEKESSAQPPKCADTYVCSPNFDDYRDDTFTDLKGERILFQHNGPTLSSYRLIVSKKSGKTVVYDVVAPTAGSTEENVGDCGKVKCMAIYKTTPRVSESFSELDCQSHHPFPKFSKDDEDALFTTGDLPKHNTLPDPLKVYDSAYDTDLSTVFDEANCQVRHYLHRIADYHETLRKQEERKAKELMR